MSLFRKNNKSISGNKPAAVKKTPVNIKDEPYAAVAAALYLYYTEQHDFENYVLTIKRIEKIYSPWSSKIYGLRKNPR